MSRASEPGRSTGVDVGTVAVAGAGAGAGAGVSGVETSREGAARTTDSGAADPAANGSGSRRHSQDACHTGASKGPALLRRKGVEIATGRHEYTPPGWMTHDAVDLRDDIHIFNAAWDDDGVFFYQAFNDAIADFALANQRFGGPDFKPLRMTWIKPSFAWVLYRSRYGKKHSQNRILRIKLSHETVASLLAQCQCKHGGGGSKGRVQWDPERDLYHGDGAKQHVPRKMLRRRAIQIGLSHELSQEYVASVVAIEDVSDLARRVGEAHKTKRPKVTMASLASELPNERPYLPRCTTRDLVRLQLLPPSSTK